jgi:hypothetical protein
MEKELIYVFSIIGVVGGFLFFFSKIIARNTENIVEKSIAFHDKDKNAHSDLLRKQDIFMILNKLDKLSGEINSLRDEFHIFKGKIELKIFEK